MGGGIIGGHRRYKSVRANSVRIKGLRGKCEEGSEEMERRKVVRGNCEESPGKT